MKKTKKTFLLVASSSLTISATIGAGLFISNINSPLTVKYSEDHLNLSKDNTNSINPYESDSLTEKLITSLSWNTKTKITLEDWKSIPNVTTIKNATSENGAVSPFSFNKKLQSIEVPESITKIEDQAFAGMSNLLGKNISMPNKFKRNSLEPLYGLNQEQWNNIDWKVTQFQGTLLTKTNVEALNWHTKTEITQEDWTRDAPNVTQISAVRTTGDATQAAFFNNKILTKIFIPAKITQINYSSFNGASNLITVNFDQNSQLDLIGILSFKETGLLSINIPEKTTTIGYGAFEKSTKLRTVTFAPNSLLTTIDNLAFLNVWALNEIILPNSLITISDSAFFNVSGLRKVYIPDSVTTIGNNAFTGIVNLQGNQVSMPIKFRGTDINARKYGFTQGQWNRINWRANPFVGDTLLKENVIGLGWDTKTEITLEDWNRDAPNVTQISEFAISGNGATAAFGQNATLQSITIPARITAINFASFFSTTSLSSVAFESGSNLALVGDASFRLSSISSIEIPASVTEIGKASFEEATNLTSMTFQEGSKLTKIDSLALNGATQLASLIIPDSIETIDLDALKQTTALETIQLPYKKGLFLDDNAHTPLYGLSQTQWNAISWTNIPTKDVKVNAIIARNLLKKNTVVTWEQLSPFTGIQAQSFTETNISAITIQWREGFIIENNAFSGTGLLKKIRMSIEFESAVKNFGFTNEQISLIEYITNFGNREMALTIIGSLLGVDLIFMGILFLLIAKDAKKERQATRT